MQSAIHDPLAIATPTQRQAASARRQRLARMKPRPMAPPAEKKIYISPEANYSEMWFWDLVNPTPCERGLITCVDIQLAIATHFGVTRDDIISKSRTADIVRPRQVAVYLTKKLTHLSLAEIGRRFGGRDHSTAINSIKKVARLIETEPGVREQITALTSEIRGPHA